MIEFWLGLSSWLTGGVLLNVLSSYDIEREQLSDVSANKDTNPIILVPSS